MIGAINKGYFGLKWMGIHDFCADLPTRPATQIVYGWTSAHLIPFHKKGKRIMFLKSEIYRWLIGEQLKSIREIEAGAEAFCAGRKERKIQIKNGA